MPSSNNDTQDRVVVRLPLATPVWNRPGDTAGASPIFLKNCLTEVDTATGQEWVVQRPGMTNLFLYNGGAATNGQGMAYYKGGIYAMGSNTLYRLSGAATGSATGAAWTNYGSAPWHTRQGQASCVFQNRIWIMGGVDGTGFNFFNDVWSSPDGITWSQVVSSAPWTPRQAAIAVAFGDTMFLISGDGSNADVWSTQDGVNWTQVVANAPWKARTWQRVCVFNNGIWLMGGYDGTNWLNDIWFSPDGSTWSQQTFTPGWSARGGFSLVVYNGKMWVMGGRNAAYLQDVWSTLDGVIWTNTGNLPAVRWQMPSVVYTNKIFMVGGADGATSYQTVWSTTDGVTFTVVAANYGGGIVSNQSLLALPAATSISAINAQTMWMLGGVNGGGVSNAIWYATLNVALPASWAIATTGATTDQFKFTLDDLGKYLVFKNNNDAWVLDTGTVVKISDTNYPTFTVPGIVTLDDTVYVMGVDGTIYGADISNPFKWDAMSFVTAEFEADTPMALAKHQNYVVALKSQSTQFFYDAGIAPPAAAIAPLVNANSNVGCAFALSVAQGGNTLFWVAQTKQRGPFVVMLNGLQPVEISDFTINRILANASGDTTVTGFCLQSLGHLFYVLNCKNIGVCLVYDVEQKRWHQWAQSTFSAWNCSNYVTDGTADYLQNDTLGQVNIIAETELGDPEGAFDVVISTPQMDAGNNQWKYMRRVELIGDTTLTSLVWTIQWYDNNWLTLAGTVTVNMTSSRPGFSQVGAFRKRAFRLTSTSSTERRRMLALEATIDQGAF